MKSYDQLKGAKGIRRSPKMCQVLVRGTCKAKVFVGVFVEALRQSNIAGWKIPIFNREYIHLQKVHFPLLGKIGEP